MGQIISTCWTYRQPAFLDPYAAFSASNWQLIKSYSHHVACWSRSARERLKKTALTLEKEHPVQTCTYSTQRSKSCLNKPAFASRCYSQNIAQVSYVFAYFSSNVISMETSWLTLILDVETALQLLGNTLDHAKLAVSLSFQDLC